MKGKIMNEGIWKVIGKNGSVLFESKDVVKAENYLYQHKDVARDCVYVPSSKTELQDAHDSFANSWYN